MLFTYLYHVLDYEYSMRVEVYIRGLTHHWQANALANKHYSLQEGLAKTIHLQVYTMYIRYFWQGNHHTYTVYIYGYGQLDLQAF